jgi:hypothetical protein
MLNYTNTISVPKYQPQRVPGFGSEQKALVSRDVRACFAGGTQLLLRANLTLTIAQIDSVQTHKEQSRFVK